MADAAQDSKAKPPREVTMVNRIETWGDPWGGGWMGWPAGDVTRLTIAKAITTALRSAANIKPGQWGAWEKANPGYAKTYDDVLELRSAMAANDGN